MQLCYIYDIIIFTNKNDFYINYINQWGMSLLMTFINILIVAIWKSSQAFRAYGWGNMPLQVDKLPIYHNYMVGENTFLQRNILETGVLTVVFQNNSSPMRRGRPTCDPLVWEHQSPKCFDGEPTIWLFQVIRISVNSAAFCRRRYQQEETTATVQLSVLAVGSGWVFVNNEDCHRWEFMSQPTLFSMELHVGIE